MKHLAKARMIVSWILQCLAAFGFVNIGIGKFRGTFWQQSFARWGYPDGFYMVVGSAELVGGLLLLVPKLSSYAALGLMGIMICASATHALAGQTARIMAPVPWGVTMAVIAWLRWPSRAGARARVTESPARV